MDLTEQEATIQREALEFAKKNKKVIAKRFTDPQKFPPEENPVSVFMAGSPGAGKTESSVELLKKFSGTPIIRIDPDELRSEFNIPGRMRGCFRRPYLFWLTEFMT